MWQLDVYISAVESSFILQITFSEWISKGRKIGAEERSAGISQSLEDSIKLEPFSEYLEVIGFLRQTQFRNGQWTFTGPTLFCGMGRGRNSS